MAQVWLYSSTEERPEFQDSLTQRLANGHFDYVLIAQRFTPSMLKTMEYLNNSMPGSRYYAIELVKFGAEPLSVDETRTTLKPTRQQRPGSPTPVNEVRFMEGIEDEEYKAALQHIIDRCHDLGLGFEWGSLGTSIRVRVKYSEPISVAWLFPPGKLGYMGLTDVTLGYVHAQSRRAVEAHSRLDGYVQAVASLPGAVRARPEGLEGYTFEPEAVVCGVGVIVEALARVAEEMGGLGGGR